MGKSKYIIQFGGLPIGLHEFEFEVNDTFFSNIENSEIQSGEIDITATLTKQNHLLQMHFNFEGTVKVDCDRCLKQFDFPIEGEENLVIKHGNPDESNDEILVIEEGSEEFDVSQYLYEYIILAIPARRVPCELDEKEFICDYETLDKLNSLTSESDESETDANKNPLWDQLNKLKKFNKN
ncbi:MAG: DUF177 domain-containing protein [Bacteroidota bacterium]|nr:DUF177 domain-containing protein [Bacteroidota bacterium]MDP3146278.1 DUF177 domain-containing protein [Bacteroidota bacterium]MDP3556384.1 DUF177 domain-containing protein [Bacteroidota bacterium]